MTFGRHPSTVCREIKRNKYPQAKIYTFHWALEILKWRKRRIAATKHETIYRFIYADKSLFCSLRLALGFIILVKRG